MFEDQVPKLKIGALKPLSVVDNSAYEFYRIAPPGVMLVMIPVGLGKFSKDDVERVFAPLDGYVDQLMERGVDLIMQSGVPLPLLIGIEAHDRLIDRIEKRSGKPATSSVLGVVAAAKRLGLHRIVVANKWSEAMNRTLGDFFARGGTAITGVAADTLTYASWGTAVMTDFDNDGIPDILMNGKYYLMLLRGTGGGHFAYMNAAWGITDVCPCSVDGGMTFGDIDNDGDLDIAGYANIDEPYLIKVYRNDNPARNWLRVRPTGHAGNRGAAGGKIRLYAAGTKQLIGFESIARVALVIMTELSLPKRCWRR